MDGGSIGGIGSMGSAGSSAVPTVTQDAAIQPVSGAQPVADGSSGGQGPQVGGIDGGGGASSKPAPTAIPQMNTEHFCALQQQSQQHQEDQGIDLKKLMELLIALKMMEAMGGGE